MKTKHTKILSVLIAALMLMSSLVFSAGAESDGGFEYQLIPDGTAMITGYTGGSADTITIPATVNGVSVSWVRGSLFKNCTVKTLVFSEGIRYTYLGSIDSSTVEKLVLSSTLSISPTPTSADTLKNLKVIEVPQSNPYHTVVDNVLYNKAKTQILFCPRAKEGTLTIAEGVTMILDFEIFGCNKITKVVVPSTFIAPMSAFSNCHSLLEIEVVPSNPFYVSENGVVYSKDMQALVAYPCAKNAEGFTIKSTVTQIGDYAFANSGITEITIPNAVTTLGVSVFTGCKSLESVTLGTGISSFTPTNMFYGCDKLTNINVADGSISYSSENGILYNAEPQGVTSISSNAFANCNGLIAVTIPDTVKSIGDCAFYSCTSLSQIVIPNTLNNIGTNAFGECTALKYYDWKMVTDSMVFGSSALSGTFSGGSSLKIATVPSGITSVSGSLFSKCNALEAVVVYGYTSIEDYALGFEQDIDTFEYVQKSNFTIYGLADSPAQSYAERFSIPFVAFTDEFDEATGISAIAAGEFAVTEQVENAEALAAANLEYGKAYELSLSDTAEKSIVTIPCPQDYNIRRTKIYCVNSDGAVSKMSPIINGNDMI